MARKTQVPQDDLGHPTPYDPHFKGPLKNRSCTDIICLMMFLVFIGCWIGIGAYAISAGDINTLLVPKDSSGRRCGLDSDVKDKPYLFFFDLIKCVNPTVAITGCNTPQLCVAKCPSEVYSEAAATNTILDPQYCLNGKVSIENCPKWYLPSTPVIKRCLYNVADRKRLKLDTGQVQFDEIALMKRELNIFSRWLFLIVQNTIAFFSKDEKVLQIGQNIVEDVIASWWKICIGLVIAVAVCLVYILLLRWIAAIMVWFSICGVIVALGGGLYFSAIKYKEFNDMTAEDEEVAASNKTKKDLFLAALIIASVVLLIILLMLIFLRSRILLAIALIKEGSKAVSSVTSVLVFPVFPWVLQIGVMAYAIVVGLYLTTTGKPIYRIKNMEATCLMGGKNGDICVPDNFDISKNGLSDCASATCKFIMMENPPLYPYLQVINVFGFFWLEFFVTAIGEMILASVFAQWYWTFNKKNLPFFAVTEATARTLRYHIGTLAFGSLIIAICRMVRVFLEYLDHKLKKYDNALTKAILCCLKCFFWCLEKFLKFINKNAYIMCAIHGKNFCASAKDAFLLLMRNIIRVFVLDKVTDFLFFLSKLLVTLGVGSIAYVCFVTDLTTIDNSNLKYGFVPVVIIMICTFLIASVFFSVYSMAVDTLFLCFLEDCERNDGSSTKPYYMSKNLMKILGKKNKTS